MVNQVNSTKSVQPAKTSAGSKSSTGQISSADLKKKFQECQEKLSSTVRHKQEMAGKDGQQSASVLSDQSLEDKYRSQLYSISQQMQKAQQEELGGSGGSSPLEKLQKLGASALKSASDGLNSVGKAVSNAANWFVSQIKGASNTNEDASANNQNCGPACLLMAARELGAMGGGAADANAQIEQLRPLMGASPDENVATKTSQLTNGAKKLGLQASYSSGHTGADIEKARKSGKQIIAHVNPKEYGGADTNHFVLVQSIDSKTVTLFDPGQQKPIIISRKQFDQALANHGGFAVEISK